MEGQTKAICEPICTVAMQVHLLFTRQRKRSGLPIEQSDACKERLSVENGYFQTLQVDQFCRRKV